MSLIKNIVLIFSFLLLEASKILAAPLAARTYTRDPARTPKEPRLSDPVTTVDGSQGKYRKKHKVINSKSWARRRKHADTVKPKKSKEKTKAKAKNNETGS